MSDKHQTPEDLIQETAFIVHPYLQTSSKSNQGIDQDLILLETEGLARAINLDVIDMRAVKITTIRPSTLLGKGQCEIIAEQVQEHKPHVIIVNHTLTPVQQRNLEKAWDSKVIDRTGLILEIFGARAQTKEGRLQVELAALDYQRSRLVRSWTHLERQRGATGFIGGPGETQIEIDRRLISERITKLKKELEDVRRTRNLGRQSRARIPLPIVSLVGYTNAGKSTLFNTLTGASVFAEDLLFATLDPTMRKLQLNNHQRVVLSDTVGFISDLPTHLIEAFRATLEHAIDSDIILHIIDISQKNWKTQRDDVIKILEDLGIKYDEDDRIFEVYNKIDALTDEKIEDFTRECKFSNNKVMVSAIKGNGTADLLKLITKEISKRHQHIQIKISAADGKVLSWLYEHSEIINRKDDGAEIIIDAMISPANLSRFERQYKYTITQKNI